MRLELAYLVHEQDVALALDDLEGIRHVSGARNPGHVALGLGVRLGPAGHVLFAPLQRTRQIRNRAALDHALTRGHGVQGAQLPERGCRCRVILEVPMRRAEGLPNAIEVGPSRDSCWSSRRRASALSCRRRGSRRTAALPCRSRCRGRRGRRAACLAGERNDRQRHRRRQPQSHDRACKPNLHLPDLLKKSCRSRRSRGNYNGVSFSKHKIFGSLGGRQDPRLCSSARTRAAPSASARILPRAAARVRGTRPQSVHG